MWWIFRVNIIVQLPVTGFNEYQIGFVAEITKIKYFFKVILSLPALMA